MLDNTYLSSGTGDSVPCSMAYFLADQMGLFVRLMSFFVVFDDVMSVVEMGCTSANADMVFPPS
jgi:hypothetical protein